VPGMFEVGPDAGLVVTVSSSNGVRGLEGGDGEDTLATKGRFNEPRKVEIESHMASAFGLIVGLLTQQTSARCQTASVNCGASSWYGCSGRTSSWVTRRVNSPGSM